MAINTVSCTVGTAVGLAKFNEVVEGLMFGEGVGSTGVGMGVGVR